MNKTKRILTCLASLLISAVLFLIMKGFGLDQVTSGYGAITICFILLVAFEALPNFLLSVILPCAYALAGVTDIGTALSPWTNTLIYLVTAGMIFSNVLNASGLLKRIALWLISKCKGRFNALIFGIYFICVFIMALTFCQGWLLLITLIVAMCQALGFKVGDKETTVIMMTCFLGVLTSTVYMYNPAYHPLIEAAAATADPSITMQWYHMYLYMFPYIPVCLLFIIGMIRFYKTKECNFASEEYAKAELKAMEPISVNEKKCAVALVFLVLYVFTSQLHGLNALYGFMAALTFLYLPGINVGKTEDILKVKMTTPIFMVACMSIGTVGTAIGFDSKIAELFSIMLTEKGETAALYSIFGLGAVANFAMTPLAILTCFLSTVSKIASQMGFNPIAAIYTLLASADFYILPYENAWALVFFGFGMIKFKDFVKLNLVRSLLLTVALGVLFIPWWGLLGVL